MDIRTVYEDNLIIVCVKPVGVESENAGMPALLASQCGLNEVFCVHRLDKGVGGLMVFAKTKFAASRLSACVSSGEMKKEYLESIDNTLSTELSTVSTKIIFNKNVNKILQNA